MSDGVLANLPAHTLRRSPPETLHDLDRAFYDEATQTMDRERLRELQDEGLREVVRRAFERPVPLWLAKLAEAGITGPDDIRGVDDLASVPVTVKQELRDSEAQHPPVGDYRGTHLRDNIRIGTSTGTTGTPTIALWTRHDLLVDLEMGARAFWRQGIRPGMILTHAHPAYLYSGGVMMTSLYEHMGCLPIWVPPPDSDEVALQGLQMWQRIRPDRPFMGFATGRFFEVAGKEGIDLMEVGLNFNAMPPLTKDGVLPLMTAGAECMAYLGSPCGEINGGHVCEDHAIVQAVDPATGREVADGQWGSLVVTTIGRDNFMIRYDLEEAAKLDRSPCPCGETHLRGWWGGRFKDLLSVQGTSVMIPDIERVLKRMKAFARPLEYVVVRPAPADDLLRVRVEGGEDAASRRELSIRGAAELGEALGVNVEVEVVEVGTIPRSGYKSQRIVDA